MEDFHSICLSTTIYWLVLECYDFQVVKQLRTFSLIRTVKFITSVFSRFFFFDTVDLARNEIKTKSCSRVLWTTTYRSDTSVRHNPMRCDVHTVNTLYAILNNTTHY